VAVGRTSLTELVDSSHGQTSPLHEHVARRIHRGFGWWHRLERTYRTGAHIYQRLASAGWHISLRATNVRDDGLLGDGPFASRHTGIHARLRRCISRSGQGRLLHDSPVSIEGPNLATQAIKAGLVDEIHQFVAPFILGGGKKFFPDDIKLQLELIDERRFDSGIVYLRHRVSQ